MKSTSQRNKFRLYLSIVSLVIIYSCTFIFPIQYECEIIENGLYKIHINTQGFGTKVDIYQNIAIVGAPYDTLASVHIFEKTSTDWECTASFYCEDSINNKYADDVAIFNDIVVFSDYLNQKVYSYRKIDNNWTEINVINLPNDEEFENFGFSIDIFDGCLFIGPRKGPAIVYKLIQNEWSEITRLNVGDFQDMRCYNIDVCITDKFAATSKNGAIYLYERQGDDFTNRVKLDSTDNIYRSLFCLIDISDTTMVVGARWIGTSWSEIHVYTYCDNKWILKDEFDCGDMMSLGYSIGVNSDIITYCVSYDFPFMKENLTIYQYDTTRTEKRWEFKKILKYDSPSKDVGISNDNIIWSGNNCAYIYEYR
ncbi:MAG: hypothetical protein KAU44_01345 [Candidatus Marinimicrobia bacterium]|nr:hypothetical protein [Candidatus Neomarinimicrobiota bacterium]